jgi:hypothetical protein
MSNAEEVKLEAVLSRDNLKAAWAAVKANDGAAGVDRKTITATAAHLKSHWTGIRDKLLNADSQPAAVRAVEIPKANGAGQEVGCGHGSEEFLRPSQSRPVDEPAEGQDRRQTGTEADWPLPACAPAPRGRQARAATAGHPPRGSAHSMYTKHNLCRNDCFVTTDADWRGHCHRRCRRIARW